MEVTKKSGILFSESAVVGEEEEREKRALTILARPTFEVY